jgi:hypothetical protein
VARAVEKTSGDTISKGHLQVTVPIRLVFVQCLLFRSGVLSGRNVVGTEVLQKKSNTVTKRKNAASME